MMASWERKSTSELHLQIAMARSDNLRLPESLSGAPSRISHRIDPSFRSFLDRRYHKVVLLIDFIASNGAVGAEAVIEACEIFATGSARQWLKVAGDAKAEVINACLDRRPPVEFTVIAEFGAFVGYSCVRMAWRGGPGTRVVSLESDAVHVLVARYVAVEARYSHAAEIVPGMAHDTAPRLIEEWGCGGIGFVFMDHRGTRFHVDLQQLEEMQLAHIPGCQLLADNTLKPGIMVRPACGKGLDFPNTSMCEQDQYTLALILRTG